jgi:hypothetical protein
MKKLIPNIIAPEEAAILARLAKEEKKKDPILPSSIITKIKDVINSEVKASWQSPAYFRLENLGRAHDWHLDTGSKKHMLWCKYGCSILLKNNKEAGYLEYRDGTKILPDEHYCSLAIHSSDEEHRTVHQPFGRVTFLAFLK